MTEQPISAGGDLFGEVPSLGRDPRGRKPHRDTPQLAEIVELLTASGLTVDEVARLIGVTRPTLRLYYLGSLERGRARRLTSRNG